MAFACLLVLLHSLITSPHCESTVWWHKQASGIEKVLCQCSCSRTDWQTDQTNKNLLPKCEDSKRRCRLQFQSKARGSHATHTWLRYIETQWQTIKWRSMGSPLAGLWRLFPVVSVKLCLAVDAFLLPASSELDHQLKAVEAVRADNRYTGLHRPCTDFQFLKPDRSQRWIVWWLSNIALFSPQTETIVNANMG